LTVGDRAAYGAQDWIQVTSRDLGHGHVETTQLRVSTLSDLPPWWGRSKTERWDKSIGEFVDDGAVRGEGDREASRQASAKRAKRSMRQRCKGMGLDVLGTLTYRANVQDRDRVLRDWKEFVRRLRRVLPSFSYVAVLEKQKRGALHIHFACRRLPREFQREGVRVKSYSVIYAIWKSVAGEDGGSFRDSSRKTRGSPLKVAKYISKYVGKSFEESHDLNKRQYFSGGEWSAPLIDRRLFPLEAWVDAYAFADAAHGDSAELDVFNNTRFGLVWIASYTPPS
jgi:hypothetical protein